MLLGINVDKWEVKKEEWDECLNLLSDYERNKVLKYKFEVDRKVIP